MAACVCVSVLPLLFIFNSEALYPVIIYELAVLYIININMTIKTKPKQERNKIKNK